LQKIVSLLIVNNDVIIYSYNSADLFKKLKEGFIECSTNLPLGIGIATNALARLNSVLITVMI
jgi:hypothetical protein